MQNQTKVLISSVYGPVESWRLGKSLGIDLVMDPSTCSFNCTYCQLGFIQKITNKRKLFVRTKKVIKDFLFSNWKEADIITFSGSGEPSLAKNIGEVIKEIKSLINEALCCYSLKSLGASSQDFRSGAIKKITNKKIAILTNGTLFNDPQVREDVLNADVISVKLDAPDNKTLQAINRPATGINLETILTSIKKLKTDINTSTHQHKITLQVQTMFMPQNKNQIEELAKLLNEIKPDEVALNTPTRPYPSNWDIITRGAHGDDIKKIKFPTKPLKQLTHKEAEEIENKLSELTGLKIISVFEPKPSFEHSYKKV